EAVAVGMQSPAEVDFNVRLFSGLAPLNETVSQLSAQPRRLLVESWCVGCGRCQKRCSSGAIRVLEGKAVVEQQLCRLCGYCAAVCPEFCLKII
ncbi:MAG: 4Fe-4S binding protein, partial [Clostridia bacterium]|nr:4Fe-4S binding protein [Clostridia bacterium]